MCNPELCVCRFDDLSTLAADVSKRPMPAAWLADLVRSGFDDKKGLGIQTFRGSCLPDAGDRVAADWLYCPHWWLQRTSLKSRLSLPTFV